MNAGLTILHKIIYSLVATVTKQAVGTQKIFDKMGIGYVGNSKLKYLKNKRNRNI